MKGTIAKCLGEMVSTQIGQETWEKSLEDIGLNRFTMFWPTADIDDTQVMNLLSAVCRNSNLSLAQLADAFGDYWINVYARHIFPQYYAKHTTARDFLVDMDNVHVEMTRTLRDARPPRFGYSWQDDKTLIIHYQSHRGLLEFVIGLVKGVGRYYGEDLQVKQVDADRVQVVFTDAK